MTDAAFESRLAHGLLAHADQRLLLDDPHSVATRAIGAARPRTPLRVPPMLRQSLLPAALVVALLTGAAAIGGRLFDQHSGLGGPNGAMSPLPSPTASGAASLMGTYWRLTALAPDDAPIALVTDSPVWLRIDDQQVLGETECGSWYEGTATVEGDVLDFGDRWYGGACESDGGFSSSASAPLGRDYLWALVNVDQWSIEDDTLTLADEAGKAEATFTAMEPPGRDLTGRWTLTKTDVPDGQESTPVPIEFTGTTVRTDVGCGPIEGTYRQDGPLLHLGLLSLTDWGCTRDDPQAREVLRGILQSAYSVGVTDTGYVLRDRGGSPALGLTPLVVSPPVRSPSPAIERACGPSGPIEMNEDHEEVGLEHDIPLSRRFSSTLADVRAHHFRAEVPQERSGLKVRRVTRYTGIALMYLARDPITKDDTALSVLRDGGAIIVEHKSPLYAEISALMPVGRGIVVRIGDSDGLLIHGDAHPDGFRAYVLTFDLDGHGYDIRAGFDRAELIVDMARSLVCGADWTGSNQARAPMPTPEATIGVPGVDGWGESGDEPPTKGSLDGAVDANGQVIDARTPDFIGAWGADGVSIAGYVAERDLTPTSDPAPWWYQVPSPPDAGIPVYAGDLRTLVGHMAPGSGFVPLSLDPDGVGELTLFVRTALASGTWFAVLPTPSEPQEVGFDETGVACLQMPAGTHLAMLDRSPATDGFREVRTIVGAGESVGPVTRWVDIASDGAITSGDGTPAWWVGGACP